ncbi:MAG: alpha-glucosidase/alpha-galactosidase [Victivallaceae bacterium]
MPKKLKIAFIGGGSLGFTRRLILDLLMVPEFHHTDFALHDINEHNLFMVLQILERDIAANGLAATVRGSLDRREALKDADYVICCVRQGGLEAFRHDVEIPLKYGVDQCVGDTLGPGGILYGQRTIAAVLDFCRDIREVARPGALLLNYSNPNAMVTWACNQYGKVPTVGLCHGVQHGAQQIADALKIPREEFDYKCIGINHQTWYVEVRRSGQLVPQQEIYDAMMAVPKIRETEKVRMDMFKRFGYFSTESNGHLSEYLPFYRKRPSELPEWIDLKTAWIHGETGGYLRVCTEERNWFEAEFPELIRKEPAKLDNRSHEHGSFIIEGLETGRIYRGHFNVVNRNHITNLPNGCIVEIPGYVDRNGFNMPVYGDLPLGCAAICSASVRVQQLAVEAAVHGDAELLKQAMLLDPLTGAVCTPPEVWQLADEMLVAEAEWLPQYQDYIPEAKRNLAENYLTPGAPPVNPATRLELRETGDIVRARRDAEAKAIAEKQKVEYNPDKRI